MKTLLVLTAATLLLVGCSTPSVHHAEQWEYRIAAPPSQGFNQANQVPDYEKRRKSWEAFLNDMGKDGWILIEKDEAGYYYFKRVKR